MKNRIKIIYILEATGGGTRRHITQILLHLDLDKFEPILFCAVKRDRAFINDIELIRQRRIKVVIFPMNRAISPVSDLCAILKMTGAIRKEKPDIVHTHSSKAGIIGRIAAERAGVPKVIHTPHVFPFEMAISPLKKRFYLMLERMAAKKTDLLLAVSQSEKAVAMEYGLFKEGNVIVNENGIELESWQKNIDKRNEIREQAGIPEDSFVVGMVARFMPQKGHEILISAAEILLKNNPKIHFALVGDGELKNKIRNLTIANQTNKYFHFFTQTDNIAAYYSMFNCLVLPSFWEACPYTIMEAMAMGIPVIASAVGGVAEIIKDKKSGLLVPPDDGEKLADAIARLCEDRKFAEEMGKNGRKRIMEKFLLSDSIKRLEEIYKVLIEE